MQSPTVIFDFNRTIYDPDTKSMVPGALETLTRLSEQGALLYLISRKEGGRENTADDLGLRPLFLEFIFADDKEPHIARLIESSEGEVYVVGDHLFGDIRAGNRAGARTIWFRRGQFADLAPELPEDRPWRTVSGMDEVLDLIPS